MLLTRYNISGNMSRAGLFGDNLHLTRFTPAFAMGWVDPRPDRWTDEKPETLAVEEEGFVFLLLRVDSPRADSRAVALETARRIRSWREKNPDSPFTVKVAAKLRKEAREAVMERMEPRIGLHPVVVHPGDGEVWLLNPSRTAAERFVHAFHVTFQADLAPMTGHLETDLTTLWRKAFQGILLEDGNQGERFVVSIGDQVDIRVERPGDDPFVMSLRNPDAEALAMADQLVENQGGELVNIRLCLGADIEEGPIVGMVGLRKGRAALDVDLIPEEDEDDVSQGAAANRIKRILAAADLALARLDDFQPVQDNLDEKERRLFLEVMRQGREMAALN